ncbi:FACT complex subunit SPT16-like protein [Tanacetum coccineum]
MGRPTLVASTWDDRPKVDLTITFREKEGVKPKVKFEPKLTEAIFSKATLRSNNHELSKEESRRSSSRTSNDFTAYENPYGVPQPRERIIMVDEKNEAILIQIYGLMVPFHVATVKPVTVSERANGP